MDRPMPTAALMSPLFVPLCVVAFVALRLSLIAFLDVTPDSDAAWYYARAVGLAAGEGYSEGGLPTAFWPVGYPAMLGVLFRLFGSQIIVGQLANLGFSCACLAGLYILARRLTGDPLVSRLAMLILTLYPNQISYTALLLSELFYTSVLLWAFIFATGRKSYGGYAVSGFLFGLASLTKSQTILFPTFLSLLLLVIDFFYRERTKGSWIRIICSDLQS